MLNGILYERHLSHLSLCLLRDLCVYFTIIVLLQKLIHFNLIEMAKRRKKSAVV